MDNLIGRLRYVDESIPGITRRKRGAHFHFLGTDGQRISDAEEVARLRAIGMPPAYRDCWFCPDPHGHLQATGFDARGRKQYRYHLEFRAHNDAQKFALCAEFGAALPRARARVETALQQRQVTRERTLAAIVRLLDVGLLRVGNADYARANGSYGATTLTQDHATVRGGKIMLQYRGKSGKDHEIVLRDTALLRFVRQMQDLPGQRLFQYVDADGVLHQVGSSDVNAWLHETMGAAFTAKHFRTWGGSVAAFSALAHADSPLSMKAMTTAVAAVLGNTPAISRKSYIHPRLLEICTGNQREWRAGLKLPRATRWLSREERGLIVLLSDESA